MSYSCTVKAQEVLNALENQLQNRGAAKTSNGWTVNSKEYFFECGLENEDGAITGTVHQIVNGLACLRGSAKIEPTGQIIRWPTTTIAMRKDAMIAGLIRYHELYEPGWNSDKLLRSLIGNVNFVVVN